MKFLLLGAFVIAATSQVEVRCKPVILKPCDNHLLMYFENGVVPSRCNVT